jgi:hypothetical protein
MSVTCSGWRSVVTARQRRSIEAVGSVRSRPVEHPDVSHTSESLTSCERRPQKLLRVSCPDVQATASFWSCIRHPWLVRVNSHS